MKSSAKNSDSVDNSDEDVNNRQMDLSILRKPITTSISSFLEVKKTYDNGTGEIKKLLAHECDIIYECKVCRSIFRSLVNFISHKRLYCRDFFNTSHHFHFPSNGFIDTDISTILQAENDYVNYPKTKNIPNINNSNNTNNSNSITKDLSSIIERLLKKQNNNRLNKMTDFYDKINHKLTQHDMLKKEHVIELNRINESSNMAVYQTIRETNDDENMKIQVNEIHEMLLNDKTVLGPDGKIITLGPNLSNNLPPIIGTGDEVGFNNSTNSISFQCDECDLFFVTEKTLDLHKEMKHTPSTYVYQCPSCSLTFKQPAAVIRHLSNDHKKSMRRIRTLRDSIFKKRTRIDEIVVKGPSRELNRLQVTEQDRVDAAAAAAAAENDRAWIENMENFDNQPMCPNCGKKFERKAVLTTHMNSCVLKANKIFTKQLQQAKAITKDSIIPSGSTSITIKSEKIDCYSNENSNSATEAVIIESNFHNKLTDNIDNMIDSENSSVKSESILKEKENITTSSNKRKRKRTVRIAVKNDNENNYDDEIYWSMDEDNSNSMSVKKFIKETDFNAKKAKTETVVTPKLREKSAPAVPEKKISSNDKEHTTCNLCAKKFSTYYNLKRHVHSFHCNQNRNRFTCSLCAEFITYKKSIAVEHVGAVHNVMGDKDIVNAMINVEIEDITNEVDFNSANENFVLLSKNKSITEVTNNNSRVGETSIDLNNGCETESKIEDDQSNHSSISTSESCDSMGAKKKALKPKNNSKKSLSQPSPVSDLTSDGSLSKSPKNELSRSNSSSSIPLETNLQKRPIRNRVKPVNKDFVYDLSGLLKKESEMLKDFSLPSSFLTMQRTQKRKPSNTSTLLINDSIEKIVKNELLPELTITMVNTKTSTPKNRSSSLLLTKSIPLVIDPKPITIDSSPEKVTKRHSTDSIKNPLKNITDIIPPAGLIIAAVNNGTTVKSEVSDDSNSDVMSGINGSATDMATGEATLCFASLPVIASDGTTVTSEGPTVTSEGTIVACDGTTEVCDGTTVLEDCNGTKDIPVSETNGDSQGWTPCSPEPLSLLLKMDGKRKYKRPKKSNSSIVDKSNVNSKIRKYKKRLSKKVVAAAVDAFVNVNPADKKETPSTGPAKKTLKMRRERKKSKLFINATDENAFLQRIREFKITTKPKEPSAETTDVDNKDVIIKIENEDVSEMESSVSNHLTSILKNIAPTATVTSTVTSNSYSSPPSPVPHGTELSNLLTGSLPVLPNALTPNNGKRITLLQRLQENKNKKKSGANQMSSSASD